MFIIFGDFEMREREGDEGRDVNVWMLMYG